MNLFTVLFLAAVALFGLSKPAFAYIDPGSGSMILQAIVLAFVAGWFAVKNYWLRIIGFFKRDPEPNVDSDVSNKTKHTG